MFIAIYIVLSIVNANAEVPEWIYLTSGIAALIEFSFYAFIFVAAIISSIIEKVKGK